MKKVLFATIATFLLPFVAKATEYGDSLKLTIPERKDSVMNRKEITFVGVPIFLSGIIAKGEKMSFRQNTKDNKHTLVTDFRTNIDNYTQFFGPALATGLKLAHVEGRSDWGRYLASSAMSYGIMAAMVNSIKYTTKEIRPDGSTANSWPSGHTATAFAGATILHKEYGTTVSPWYSVLGYGVATATGVMRVLNNRHWISDVLSGAGIGILSTELGYSLGDIIFKKKGLLRKDICNNKNIIDHPSFFAISMGGGFGFSKMNFNLEKLNIMFDDYHNEDKILNLRFGTSTAVGVEGAYFLNKHIGIGGRLRVNSFPIEGWSGIEHYAWDDLINNLYDGYEDDVLRRFVEGEGVPGQPGYSPALVEDAYFTIKSDHLTEFTADLGAYFNIPLSKRLALGTKLLIGHSIMQEVDLNATVKGGRRELYDAGEKGIGVRCLPDTYTTTWDYFTMGGHCSVKLGTGFSLTYAYKENYAWRLFADYDYTRRNYTITYSPGQFLRDALTINTQNFDDEIISESQSIKKNQNTFVVGGSFVISF